MERDLLLPPVTGDGQPLGTHVQGGGDVAVDELLGQGEFGSGEDLENSVRADQPDELHVAAAGDRDGRAERCLGRLRGEADAGCPLGGRGPLQRRVAMVGVVEGLEGGRSLPQLGQVPEPLGAEEALVEGCR